MNAISHIVSANNSLASWRSLLSDRETVIIHAVSEGHSNKVIAYEVGITEATVKVHVRNIMRKLGARNRTDAAIKALHLAEMTTASAKLAG